MRQPRGYEQGDGQLMCKLTKVLYGLKQAPRAWDSKEAIDQVIQQLNHKFALKDLGDLHYFLRIQVTKTDAGGLVLSQERSVVGSLQYLTVTRPELSYCVGRLSQFMHTPLDEHWKLVKRVLRYISGTASFGLHLHRTSSHNIAAYSDSDWGGDPDDRKSTGGFCVFLGRNLLVDVLTKSLSSAAFLDSRTKLMVEDLEQYKSLSVRFKEEDSKEQVNSEQYEKAETKNSSNNSRSHNGKITNEPNESVSTKKEVE
nr:uncharacterized protein LOC112703228 [Arachis hypogaea]